MEKEQTNIIDGMMPLLPNCIMHHTDKYMVSSWH